MHLAFFNWCENDYVNSTPGLLSAHSSKASLSDGMGGAVMRMAWGHCMFESTTNAEQYIQILEAQMMQGICCHFKNMLNIGSY